MDMTEISKVRGNKYVISETENKKKDYNEKDFYTVVYVYSRAFGVL